MNELTDFEKRVIEKVQADHEKNQMRGTHGPWVNIWKLVCFSLLFLLAYFLRHSFWLPIILVILWVGDIVLSLSYAKLNKLFSEIVFKLALRGT